MLITYNAGAGSLTTYREKADFFRLMKTVGNVTIYFYRQGREVARADDVQSGYAERFDESFDEIAIESDTAQSVQFVLRYGNQVYYDTAPTGLVTVQNVVDVMVQNAVNVMVQNALTASVTNDVNVLVKNTSGAFSQNQKTVTNASGQVLAVNANRRYLMIQNNDAAGDIFVTVDGTAATTAKGLKVPAGGALELAGFVPAGAINAIGSIANNANIVAVEG